MCKKGFQIPYFMKQNAIGYYLSIYNLHDYSDILEIISQNCIVSIVNKNVPFIEPKEYILIQAFDLETFDHSLQTG